jgi:hypothetical protein
MKAPLHIRSTLVFATKGGLQGRYEVTEDDILWLTRAVEKEGAVARQVAQTLVNCFCRESKKYATLTRFVRAYAQPINPRWFPEGDLFQLWHGRDAKKYPLAAAKLRRDVHSTKTDFSEVTVVAVARALLVGPKDIAPHTTDYAASWIDASKKYVALTEPQKGVNRLWSRDVRWRGYSIA